MAKIRLGMTYAEMVQRIEKGEMQLHEFPLGSIITEVKQFPTERVLIVQLIAGERLDEWKGEAHARLRQFAKEHDCKAIEALCRLGLEPKLKTLGWIKKQVLLRNDL